MNPLDGTTAYAAARARAPRASHPARPIGRAAPIAMALLAGSLLLALLGLLAPAAGAQAIAGGTAKAEAGGKPTATTK